MEQTKKDQIKKSLAETREKRKSQKCTVFELKVDYSKLSTTTKNKLRMFFLEAKWLYNHILNEKDLFKFDYKTNIVNVRTKDKKIEKRELKFLPAKNKQDVFYGVKNNIKNLSNSKKKGNKVGKLKFKSFYSSIDLSQYGTTHRVTNKNRIKINGIKTPLHVHGLNQITPDYEFANAKLIRKSSGYYIKLTCFRFIGIEEIKIKGKEVGIDYGIKTNITTSDGEKFNITVAETDRLKRIQRKIAKAKKGSNNRWKLRMKLQKEYENIDNQKKDKANKLVNYLLTKYDTVYMQDENLKGWHSGLFGKQVQHSCMGTIKAKLKNSPQVKIIGRYDPSTKLCYNCGKLNSISLDERTYKCECGLEEDRDIKAAKTIMYLGQCKLKYIPTERRKSKPEENETSTIPSLESKSYSLNREALAFRQG